MKDIMGLMKQAREMQAKMQEMQESLAEAEATGASGGGMVTVTLDGKGMMKSVAIDPSLLQEGEEDMLEDLVLAAHNAARERLDAVIAEKTSELTAGLPIPPGMKLPF
ncbi:MAG: YbaB/EbfC family nucleoid-associated protein [Pseudomonadota bacterium]|nr:YbaB/EbfC family nucleoid-associated protein [Pseudomonadota bacterium]